MFLAACGTAPDGPVAFVPPNEGRLVVADEAGMVPVGTPLWLKVEDEGDDGLVTLRVMQEVVDRQGRLLIPHRAEVEARRQDDGSLRFDRLILGERDQRFYARVEIPGDDVIGVRTTASVYGLASMSRHGVF
jgi:hypothetical protein